MRRARVEAAEISRESRPSWILRHQEVGAEHGAQALPQRWRRLRGEALGWRLGAAGCGAGSQPDDGPSRAPAPWQRLWPAWPWQGQERRGTTAAWKPLRARAAWRCWRRYSPALERPWEGGAEDPRPLRVLGEPGRRAAGGGGHGWAWLGAGVCGRRGELVCGRWASQASLGGTPGSNSSERLPWSLLCMEQWTCPVMWLFQTWKY